MGQRLVAVLSLCRHWHTGFNLGWIFGQGVSASVKSYFATIFKRSLLPEFCRCAGVGAGAVFFLGVTNEVVVVGKIQIHSL
jgi:hypothetical protein